MFVVPKFCTEQLRGVRVIIFVLMALFGVVPIIHLFQIYGLNNQHLMHSIKEVAFMYLLYGIGTLFYVVRLPERWFRKKFDIWVF